MLHRVRYLAAVLALGLFACAEPASSPVEAPTWTRDVAPLVHQHCLPCHLPDGPAPFALATHRDVSRRGRQVVEVVRTGFMPPWLPDDRGPALRGRRGLTEEEVEVLAAWVAAGAPQGDGPDPTPPAAEPWPLGEPDLVLEGEGWVDIPPEGDGILHTVVLPASLGEERDLVAVQLRPSTPRALHGVGWLFDRTGYGPAADAGYPGPGFREMGGVGMNTIGALGAWAPGRAALPLPGEHGFRVGGDGAFLVQLHLKGTGKPERERPSLGLYFAEEPRSRPVMDLIMGSLCVDIPAGDPEYLVTDELVLPVSTELVGLYPKARYLCSRMVVRAEAPDGTVEVLLSISDYDFNWLEPFWYEEPVQLAAGTRLLLEFVYDNSSGNLRNPSHPPQRAGLGRDADDEMAFLMLYLAPDEASDLEVLEALHQQGFRDRIEARRAWQEGR